MANTVADFDELYLFKAATSDPDTLTYDQAVKDKDAAIAAGLGNNIAVRLVGSNASFSSNGVFSQYGITGPESFCWNFDMVDIKTGNSIGYATDCGAIIGVVGEGLQVLGTTIFHFPGGTVTSRVYTTVQPTTHGSMVSSNRR